MEPGFVPVVALHDAKKAAGLAGALKKGGTPIIDGNVPHGRSVCVHPGHP